MDILESQNVPEDMMKSLRTSRPLSPRKAERKQASGEISRAGVTGIWGKDLL